MLKDEQLQKEILAVDTADDREKVNQCAYVLFETHAHTIASWYQVLANCKLVHLQISVSMTHMSCHSACCSDAIAVPYGLVSPYCNTMWTRLSPACA